VADPLVVHADLEEFLCAWYREALAARPEDVCKDVEVDNSEPLPGTAFPEKLLVIHDFGGADTSVISAERDVGLSVLAGTKENPYEANQLARIVHALRTQIPSVDPGNPVAAVLRSNGPYPVEESQQRARRYISLTLSVVGSQL
jgi:hypothetical protein